MTDYAAAPVQPIVQGLISLVFVEEQIAGISFFGIGIIPTGPKGPLRNNTGDYTLTLDEGLPGDVAMDPPFSRVLITPRALASGVPTLVLQKSQTFLVNPLPGVGSNQIEILFTGAGGTPVDSTFEIIIWRGDAGVDLVNAKIIGPLFPNP